MASNKHGGWKDFNNYGEFRYLLAILILSTLYTGVQAFRHVHEISTRKQIFQRHASTLIDFAGDQIIAYLLASSASTAIPMTNRMSDSVENLFTQSSAASISMAFLAFIMLALYRAHLWVQALDTALHLVEETSLAHHILSSTSNSSDVCNCFR